MAETAARVVFDRDDGVLPWLYAVANNVERNQARRSRRFARFLGQIAERQPPVGDPSVQVADEERMRGVLDAVRRLPRREQDVLALCVFGDLSYARAATALGVPVGTVRSRLARARRRLGELSPEKGHESADTASSVPRASG